MAREKQPYGGDYRISTYRIPAKMIEQLGDVAKRRGITRSAVVRDLLAEGLEKNRQSPAVEHQENAA